MHAAARTGYAHVVELLLLLLAAVVRARMRWTLTSMMRCAALHAALLCGHTPHRGATSFGSALAPHTLQHRAHRSAGGKVAIATRQRTLHLPACMRGMAVDALHCMWQLGRGGQPAVHAAAAASGGGRCTGGCAATSSGATSLRAASSAGQDACVGLLAGVGVGASGTSAVTAHGATTPHTPLHFACSLVRAACVRSLLCSGAEREAKASGAATPLYKACEVGCVESVKCERVCTAGGRREQGGSDRAAAAAGDATLHVAAVSQGATPRVCVCALLAEGAREQGSHQPARVDTTACCMCRWPHAMCVRLLIDRRGVRM
ncbi:ankyrin repeat domain-containing protein [bacterium]|nr:MAG: ankyrin repeat domain-containing protein [bacterium]